MWDDAVYFDEGAVWWADYHDKDMPWCCWNVLYNVVAIERRMEMGFSLPKLDEKVPSSRCGNTSTLKTWILGKGRKRMAVRACRELGCDPGVADFFVQQYNKAIDCCTKRKNMNIK